MRNQPLKIGTQLLKAALLLIVAASIGGWLLGILGAVCAIIAVPLGFIALMILAAYVSS